mmetsp:Transcript_25652/g.71763  ORF Transcript_25652/g.71763 Transcript_25652/m.71763 type:complete len:249 (-) Transcript_25652:1273-2019(-)
MPSDTRRCAASTDASMASKNHSISSVLCHPASSLLPSLAVLQLSSRLPTLSSWGSRIALAAAPACSSDSSPPMQHRAAATTSGSVGLWPPMQARTRHSRSRTRSSASDEESPAKPLKTPPRLRSAWVSTKLRRTEAAAGLPPSRNCSARDSHPSSCSRGSPSMAAMISLTIAPVLCSDRRTVSDSQKSTACAAGVRSDSICSHLCRCTPLAAATMWSHHLRRRFLPPTVPPPAPPPNSDPPGRLKHAT